MVLSPRGDRVHRSTGGAGKQGVPRVKAALIVDDSRLARAVLARVLGEHGVRVDEVDSAEAALEYLKGHRPDVVFLDHQMPGMDGFEALEAIKANPVTATIPVMMYTSQEGQLYVGQARALGALGVLPKSLQPVEFVNVLRRLRLISDDGQSNDDAEPASAADVAASSSIDTRRIQALIEALFYEQANALRDEVRKEFQRADALFRPVEPPAFEQRRSGFSRYILALTLVALTMTSANLALKANALLAQAEPQSSIQSAEMLAVERTSAPRSLPRWDEHDLLEMLEWAANRDGAFGFESAPFDEARAESVATLLQHLERLDFRGHVVLGVHVGRFCMNFNDDGRLALAPAEQPASLCEHVGAPDEGAVAMAARESLAFANLVSRTARDGRMRIETSSHGMTRPSVAYPASVYNVTAGEWNAAAAANQRVEVQLLPERQLSATAGVVTARNTSR